MKSQRHNQDSEEDNVSDSGSDTKQTKGKRYRDEKSESKQDIRPRKSSDDDDNSVEEESKGSEGHSELFVKNLSYNSNEKSLKSFFSKYGTVTNVKLLKRDDGKLKGIGFSSRKEAQKAIDDADNLECDGRKINVSFSNEKPSSRDDGNFKQRSNDRGNDRGGNDRGGNRDSGNTVFMGNLSFKTTEESIKKFFRDSGKVADIRIAKTPEGKMKGFCHVEFEDNEGATKACQKNGEELDERQVRIDMSRPQGPSNSLFNI